MDRLIKVWINRAAGTEAGWLLEPTNGIAVGSIRRFSRRSPQSAWTSFSCSHSLIRSLSPFLQEVPPQCFFRLGYLYEELISRGLCLQRLYFINIPSFTPRDAGFDSYAPRYRIITRKAHGTGYLGLLMDLGCVWHSCHVSPPFLSLSLLYIVAFRFLFLLTPFLSTSSQLLSYYTRVDWGSKSLHISLDWNNL